MTTTQNPRRGDVAVLSVTHPVLGTELEIGAHSIRVGPEQYLALVDELCQIAFLAPHLAPRIKSLACELGVREISQYRRVAGRGRPRRRAPIVTRPSMQSHPGSRIADCTAILAFNSNKNSPGKQGKGKRQ